VSVTGIFNAIAAWTPSYDSDVVPKVWNYNQVKEALPSAAAPIRVLMPMRLSGDPFEFVALGKTSKTTWRIVDLLLIKPVSQGDGIKSEGENMVAYAENYHDTLRSKRSPTSSSHVVGATINTGVFSWNQVDYYGVECVVTVDEYDSSA
jgi:hypothetical protein